MCASGALLVLILLGFAAPSSAWNLAGCITNLGELSERNSLPSDPIRFFDAVTAQAPEAINVFSVPELTNAHAVLIGWVEQRIVDVRNGPNFPPARYGFSREVLLARYQAVLTALISARTARNQNYRDFLHLFEDAFDADDRGQFLYPAEGYSRYRSSSSYINLDSALTHGVAILPIIRDTPLSQESILRLMDGFVAPVQLPSNPHRADGDPRSPGNFARHDVAHAYEIVGARTGPRRGLYLDDLRARPPQERQRILETRRRERQRFWERVEALPPAQHQIVISILFEFEHEGWIRTFPSPSVPFERAHWRHFLNNADLRYLVGAELARRGIGQVDSNRIYLEPHATALQWLSENL